MRTVVSTSHPDPSRAPRDELDGALDPALAEPFAMAPASPPPQYIAGDGEWGDVPRLPPILQVEKQHVTTTATQAASASRRRNDAQFKCPVPGCGSTFTRRFNLRGHLRSHTEERPFVCEWPNCNKGFARQHDCKRHYALHNAKPNQHLCEGCGKTFSRTDALNRHRKSLVAIGISLTFPVRSDGGSGCRKTAANNAAAKAGPSSASAPPVPIPEPPHDHVPGALNGHYPISLAVQGPPADPNLPPHMQHQLPPELSSQFLAGLLSGQQFLAAAAAANDPNHAAHPYDPIIQPPPVPAPPPESAPDPANLEHITVVQDEGIERPAKRRAVSVGSEIVSVPVTASGAEQQSPASSTREQADDDESTPA